MSRYELLMAYIRPKANAIPKNNRKDLHGYKLKYEMGIELPLDFYYPEFLFRPRPVMVTDPWKTMDEVYKLKASLLTPFKKLKRKII